MLKKDEVKDYHQIGTGRSKGDEIQFTEVAY